MNEIKDYKSRFGFHTTPFTCEVQPEEYFNNETYKDSLEQLYRTVNKRMSAALVAPAGSGKTALLRSLVSQLPQTRYQVHYVKVTDLSKRDLCREISRAIGLELAGNYPTLVRRLQDRFAGSLDTDGIRPVLILDEAHDMRMEVLGLLRILTNFEMDSRLVVSIILSGQSPLKKMLDHPKLEDVARRLAHFAGLRLLSRKETIQYIQHRCRIAGSDSVLFENNAAEAIFEIGHGNMRATDYLALKSLEIAHDEDCDVVNSNHITHARSKLWN